MREWVVEGVSEGGREEVGGGGRGKGQGGSFSASRFF